MSSEINMTELYFEWWLNELKEIGLVKSFEREPETFVLFQAYPIFYNQHYKTKKPLVKNFNLCRAVTYTPDYKVLMSIKLVNKLFGVINYENKELLNLGFKEAGSVYQETLFYAVDKTNIIEEDCFVELWFDVKPPANALRYSGKLGSSREFPYNQRLVYENNKIFVNKVVPVGDTNCLFAKTFLPKRYLWSDKAATIRKLKKYEEKAKTLKQYLESKEINL